MSVINSQQLLLRGKIYYFGENVSLCLITEFMKKPSQFLACRLGKDDALINIFMGHLFLVLVQFQFLPSFFWRFWKCLTITATCDITIYASYNLLHVTGFFYVFDRDLTNPPLIIILYVLFYVNFLALHLRVDVTSIR